MQPTTSSLNDELESVDLNTDNLPAVDTPDACDKAAMRWVLILADITSYNKSECGKKDKLSSAHFPGEIYIYDTMDGESRKKFIFSSSPTPSSFMFDGSL